MNPERERSPKFVTNVREESVNLGVLDHEWSGEGLQHLLGATKRAFSARQFESLCLGICNLSNIFWDSDYRQGFPYKSTYI